MQLRSVAVVLLIVVTVVIISNDIAVSIKQAQPGVNRGTKI